MPIEVEGPDGAVIEFPDGTPAEEMKAAMRRYYAGWQAQGTPSTAQPAAAPARPVSILDSLTPPGVDKRPGDFIGYPEQPALGDFLRPVFGGHNPLAEIYGKFIDPFVPSEPETEEEKARADWLANRGYGERALDTLAAVGNLPVAVVTGGRASVPDILNYFGLTGAAQSYGRSLEDFSAANAPQLEALGAVGEVALGVPALSSLGRMPRSHVPRRAPGPAQIEPPPNPQQNSEEKEAQQEALKLPEYRPKVSAITFAPTPEAFSFTSRIARSSMGSPRQNSSKSKSTTRPDATHSWPGWKSP